MIRIARRMLVVTLLGVCLQAPAVADTLAVVPVALQGESAPEGGRYILFGDVQIDSLRRVTFTASLSGGQIGLFRARAGEVEKILLSGDPAPAGAVGSFTNFLECAGNAADDLGFVAVTSGGSRNGVFIRSAGTVRTVAQQGDPAPGPRGGFFESFEQLELTDGGDLYFVATLVDGGLPAGRTLVRATSAGLERVVAPGDRFGFIRQVEEVIQYGVNEAGEVTALAVVSESELLIDPGDFVEILQLAGGGLRTIASIDLPISRGVDLVRFFAFTFNQVKMSEAGESWFYAETNNFFHGGYFVNRTGDFLDNERQIVDGDASPLAAGDRFTGFGGFDATTSGSILFHATTQAAPRGAVFLRRGGAVEVIARAGERRPGDGQSYEGFLLLGMNESEEFVFSDFQGLAQVGIFLGRMVRPAAEIIADLRAEIAAAGLDRQVEQSLLRKLDQIESALARGNESGALQQAELLLSTVESRTGRSIPQDVADRLEPLLEDLILALGGPKTPGQPAP